MAASVMIGIVQPLTASLRHGRNGLVRLCDELSVC
jgi:hypothetical protein